MGDERDTGAGVSRRRVLKLAAGAAAALPTARVGAWSSSGGPAAAPAFFTRDQLALVDELTEILIPADEQSGGSRAAGVALEIDRQLAEAFDPADRARWVDGLTRIDARATSRHGQPFMALDPARRVALVEEMSRGERRPGSPDEEFFVEMKRRTVQAYYTSSIGIHDDLEYQGNTLQAEYSGTDVTPK
jgi:glucoside 3-dehydrogenase (cytochrome c) hitch-hiker subunit